KPCQRPIGTSASNSISSEQRASSSVFGQLISSTPSMVEMAQPRSRLVPNVPSFSLRSLNTGLVLRRGSEACVLSSIIVPLHDWPEAYERNVALAISARVFLFRSGAGGVHVDLRSQSSLPRTPSRPRVPCCHEGRPGQGAGPARPHR